MNRHTQFLLLSILWAIPSCSDNESKNAEEPEKAAPLPNGIKIHFTATFDDYHQRATSEYSGTIAVIRPTTRYAFVRVQEVLGGNWRPDEGTGISIAIDDNPLIDSDGNPLQLGVSYECNFEEVRDRIYSAKFSLATKHAPANKAQ